MIVVSLLKYHIQEVTEPGAGVEDTSVKLVADPRHVLVNAKAAVGFGLKAITIVSCPEPQLVVPDIITIVTDPAVLSAALGMYVGFKIVLLGEKLPEPNVVQVTELAELMPFNTGLAAFGQRLRSEPALVNGELVNTICIVSTTCKQFPFPVDVKKIITVPAVVSALLGT
jgi:hypothetical protein